MSWNKKKLNEIIFSHREFKCFFNSFSFLVKNQKKKIDHQNLNTLIADVIEETPGIGIILIFSFIHSFNKILPGSDISGVPASEIKDKILPCFIYSIIFKNFFFFH